ncbi:SIR2 family protein [uncultured Oscillibacter sp.]|uniref:SIR2 family protein n=1 Tax=uncultured Oscillibacter sp. TaxID=876091 RepID=UPI0026326410|nr:SIR2 family protein [uncultured Oscillibacter sp.]
MKYNQYKCFNIEASRPQVLLTGNGLTRNNKPWAELIQSLARDGVPVTEFTSKTGEISLPYTIMTLAMADTEDVVRKKKYQDEFSDKEYPDNPMLRSLVSLPFDAILTTNYTYEIECAQISRYAALSNKTKYACSTLPRRDGRYLLHTFNRLTEDTGDIWHIHGELRNKSSMILSHDEYARLVHEIVTYNQKRGKNYQDYGTDLKFKSWVDYFLMGDVYILGFGMDYSEFDLWWLLGRRLREKAKVGKIFYYSIKSAENRLKNLVLLYTGVEVLEFGEPILSADDKDKKNEKYQKFYVEAIEDIKCRVKNSKK